LRLPPIPASSLAAITRTSHKASHDSCNSWRKSGKGNVSRRLAGYRAVSHKHLSRVNARGFLIWAIGLWERDRYEYFSNDCIQCEKETEPAASTSHLYELGNTEPATLHETWNQQPRAETYMFVAQMFSQSFCLTNSTGYEARTSSLQVENFPTIARLFSNPRTSVGGSTDRKGTGLWVLAAEGRYGTDQSKNSDGGLPPSPLYH
jgi:hypothetical protein